MGLCMHIIAQLACMSTILLIDTPMMGVVEKTAVETGVSRSPPWMSSSGGRWRPGTGDVDGHGQRCTSVHIVGWDPEQKRWNHGIVEQRK